MSSTSGILVNQLSDHHSHFISLNTVITRKECSKFIEIHDNSDAAVDKLLLDLQNCNILEIYTGTIKSPSAVQMSKSIKQTQSVDKVH